MTGAPSVGRPISSSAATSMPRCWRAGSTRGWRPGIRWW